MPAKATADKAALSAVPSAATCRNGNDTTSRSPEHGRGGIKLDPILIQGGWVGIDHQNRCGCERMQRKTEGLEPEHADAPLLLKKFSLVRFIVMKSNKKEAFNDNRDVLKQLNNY